MNSWSVTVTQNFHFLVHYSLKKSIHLMQLHIDGNLKVIGLQKNEFT